MKKQRKAEKMIRQIHGNRRFQKAFVLLMFLLITVCLVGAAVCEILDMDFLSSLLQNVFCGLTTGLVVTIWSNTKEKRENEKKSLSQALEFAIQRLEISKLEFPTWTEANEAEGHFCQKNADRYELYSKYLQNVVRKIADIENQLNRICEYFDLDDQCGATMASMEKLKQKLKLLEFNPVGYPEPYIKQDAQGNVIEVITSDDPEFLQACTGEEINYEYAIHAFWDATFTMLEEEDYLVFEKMINEIDAQLAELQFSLKECQESCINQIIVLDSH